MVDVKKEGILNHYLNFHNQKKKMISWTRSNCLKKIDFDESYTISIILA